MNPSNRHLDRRHFLKLSLASGAAAGFGGWLRPTSAFAYGAQGALYRTLVPEGALGRTTLSWPSATGITFTIQRGTSLSGWQSIATGHPGQAGLTTFTDTDPLPDASRVFYRVALDAP